MVGIGTYEKLLAQSTDFCTLLQDIEQHQQFEQIQCDISSEYAHPSDIDNEDDTLLPSNGFAKQ